MKHTYQYEISFITRCLSIKITKISNRGHPSISPNNQEPLWQTELRSPADGGDYSNMTERNIGDGLATPDDIEPRKNYLQSDSDEEEEEDTSEQYQVWKNVNAVFAGNSTFLPQSN